MLQLTEEQIVQLAPDASSLKSGRELSAAHKWQVAHNSDRAIWGEVQGSGKDPYRTAVDLVNLAFKCSCPSRKFPCKHGIGLTLNYAAKGNSFGAVAEEPAWVKEWMDKRSAKAEQAIAPAPTEELDEKTKEKREKDKAKRAEGRMELVQAGAAQLELWLKDLVRGGLLSMPDKGAAAIDHTAARMVDAKAPGLANQVRQLGKINYYSGTAWHSEVLQQATETFLILEAFRNGDQQAPALREDIKQMVGWSIEKAQLLENEEVDVVDDNWFVICRITEKDGDITAQKQWLLGLKSQRYALLLDFAYKNTLMQNILPPGACLQGVLAFYPSNLPFRAIIKDQRAMDSVEKPGLPTWSDWEAVHLQYVEYLSRNPWVDEVPFFVAQLSLVANLQQWYLSDVQGALMQVHPSFDFDRIFNMHAILGGASADVCVLRKGKDVVPIGLFLRNKYVIL